MENFKSNVLLSSHLHISGGLTNFKKALNTHRNRSPHTPLRHQKGGHGVLNEHVSSNKTCLRVSTSLSCCLLSKSSTQSEGAVQRCKSGSVTKHLIGKHCSPHNMFTYYPLNHRQKRKHKMNKMFACWDEDIWLPLKE